MGVGKSLLCVDGLQNIKEMVSSIQSMTIADHESCLQYVSIWMRACVHTNIQYVCVCMYNECTVLCTECQSAAEERRPF